MILRRGKKQTNFPGTCVIAHFVPRALFNSAVCAKSAVHRTVDPHLLPLNAKPRHNKQIRLACSINPELNLYLKWSNVQLVHWMSAARCKHAETFPHQRTHLFWNAFGDHSARSYTAARSLMNSNAQEYFPSVPQKQPAQLGPTLLSLLLGLLWGAACWDWGCNEGAATPRWGCICHPKTVRQWLNEWGLNVIVMHRGQLPLHSA